jgi:hypothetical protein
MGSVLRLVGGGHTSKLSAVGEDLSGSFDHEIEAVEGAVARREDAMTVLREVPRFSLV